MSLTCEKFLVISTSAGAFLHPWKGMEPWATRAAKSFAKGLELLVPDPSQNSPSCLNSNLPAGGKTHVLQRLY